MRLPEDESLLDGLERTVRVIRGSVQSIEARRWAETIPQFMQRHGWQPRAERDGVPIDFELLGQALANSEALRHDTWESWARALWAEYVRRCELRDLASARVEALGKFHDALGIGPKE